MDGKELFPMLQDGKLIRTYIESFGVFGPVMVVLLMTLAILISPLPSAPIAIAAGAVYGHTWGTLYVLLGSICGSSGAFFISRLLGYEYLQNMSVKIIPRNLFNSQNALMGTIFVSRLLPFISFDVISYAAGLTPLVYWRFLAATSFGIVPASFFLAHIGSEMASAELNRVAIALLLLAGLSLVTFLYNKFRDKTTRQSHN